MTTVSSRAERAATTTSWVAPVGLLFWILKLTTTAFGEAASDGLAGISPALAVVVGVVGLVAAYRWQTRTHGYVAERYWSMVAAVAVFGTMLADGVHVALGLPYPFTSTLYAAATAAVFVTWRRVEGTISIHDIDNPRRERFYWGAVMCTFALGTAVGDLTAATLGLGFWPSAALFAILIAIPAVAWRTTGRHEIGWFWCAYVLTRPLGASMADGFAKPASFGHGLGVGDIPVALVLAALLCGLVLTAVGRRSVA
ncbi:membrane protein [Flexivirga endophytica]|uniref:Membrane protein n=1 Tax=Flexivirga endophytica TaxID=1849103 RepID=A0A916T446_9MICO|nr:hypothetical protein [Flexivirga endophytica]GGB31299.1 membrane protein [Flexivirga endophytica]GHB52241.1 membrane protein [Flexivirga endophytica]